MDNFSVNIQNLTVTVQEVGREKLLIKDVNLQIPSQSIVALVGGSGSGKTTTGLSILRLLSLGLNITQGAIHFEGENLLAVSKERMRQIRGKSISMVFQDPLNAFNPVFTIGYQIDEVLSTHHQLNYAQRQKRIFEVLDLVGVYEPKRIVQSYPHQLSGGLRQRAMIAQAIIASPKLLIADEPTSNLDVTLQARIMELFLELQRKLKLSILLITHDLGMVSHLSNWIYVMHQGKIVENGSTENVLSQPQHEYTQQLMEMIMV